MKLSTAVLVIGLLGIGLFVVSGCQQAEQAEPAGEAMEADEHMAREGDMSPDAGMMANMPEGKAYDVTCGMIIDKEGAATAEYKGHTFYFCADACKEAFEADPEMYVEKMRDMKAKAQAELEAGQDAAKKEAAEGM